MWEHLFLMVIEMAHAPRKLYVSTWRKYFRLRNADLLISTLTGERPTVVVAGHYGNFELSGFILGMFGFETFSVARPLDNRFLNRFVNDFRSMHGQHILPKIGSAALVDKYLARGATLAVLGDQSAGRKGMFVNFFGQSASTHKAIALFSLQHNAPLLIGFARRLGKPLHYEMGTEGVADSSDVPTDSDPVRYLTQWFTERLETIIREEPDQYWWVHRRWKDQPRKRKAASKAA